MFAVRCIEKLVQNEIPLFAGKKKVLLNSNACHHQGYNLEIRVLIYLKKVILGGQVKSGVGVLWVLIHS